MSPWTDVAVFVAVDPVLLPLARVEPEWPPSVELPSCHPAAEVRLEAGDRGQRPDPALAEFVAGGGVLEGFQVVGRDLLPPGRRRFAAQHFDLRA